MNEIFKAYIIEDEENSLEIYSEKLSITNQLKIKGIVIQKFEEIYDVIDDSPDLIVIDYNLKKTSRLFGVNLASAIISENPHIPIILISNPNMRASLLLYWLKMVIFLI